MNKSGQTLLQVLVSLGLSALLMFIMMSFQISQSREASALADRLAVNDLKRVLTTVLGTPICNKLLMAPNLVDVGSLVFDDSVKGAYPHVIEVKTVPSSVGPPTLELDKKVSELSNRLKVKSAGGILLSMVSPTEGSLQVKFDQDNLIRPVKDISFPLLLLSNRVGNIVTVSGCNISLVSRVEGENNVSSLICPGILSTYPFNLNEPFCPNAWVKHITFSMPFSTPPRVIVSLRYDSIFVTCPCCLGATDQAFASPYNITVSGFDVMTSFSPVTGGCPDAPPVDNGSYSSRSAKAHFDWIAVGQ